MENVQRSGMSKGCLISLIVVAALLVIIVIAAVTCWFYKDDLAKMAATTAVDGLKTHVAQDPEMGIDTAQFNALADAFVERLEQDEKLEFEKYSLFLQSMQGIMSDKELNPEEAEAAIDAMIRYYPELEELRPAAEEEEPSDIEDTLISQ